MGGGGGINHNYVNKGNAKYNKQVCVPVMGTHWVSLLLPWSCVCRTVCALTQYTAPSCRAATCSILCSAGTV